MARRGIQQNKKSEEVAYNAHMAHLALERIVETMADAMRSANMTYIATGGRMTPRQEAVWNDYIVYAIREAGL